jgi:hypothetical protein
MSRIKVGDIAGSTGIVIGGRAGDGDDIQVGDITGSAGVVIGSTAESDEG